MRLPPMTATGRTFPLVVGVGFAMKGSSLLADVLVWDDGSAVRLTTQVDCPCHTRLQFHETFRYRWYARDWTHPDDGSLSGPGPQPDRQVPGQEPRTPEPALPRALRG